MKEENHRKMAKQGKNEDTVEFEDLDLSFEKDIEKVGVVVQDLKRPSVCSSADLLTRRRDG